MKTEKPVILMKYAVTAVYHVMIRFQIFAAVMETGLRAIYLAVIVGIVNIVLVMVTDVLPVFGKLIILNYSGVIRFRIQIGHPNQMVALLLPEIIQRCARLRALKVRVMRMIYVIRHVAAIKQHVIAALILL
jgi:hypothetical protein